MANPACVPPTHPPTRFRDDDGLLDACPDEPGPARCRGAAAAVDRDPGVAVEALPAGAAALQAEEACGEEEETRQDSEWQLWWW